MVKQQKWLIPVLVAVVILAATIAGFFLAKPQGNELPASVTIQPDSITLTGADAQTAIPPDGSFTVQSAYSVNEAELRALLEVDPPLDYTLEGSGKSWKIKPDAPLAENTIYTFRVKSQTGAPVQSFAFQTRSDLMVERVYPADNSTWADVNTSIEVSFNTAGVDMTNYFEILPPVAGRFETGEHSCTFIPAAPLAPDSIYRITVKAGLTAGSGLQLAEDYAFSFETAPEEDELKEQPLTLDGGFIQTHLPGDPISLRFYAYDETMFENDFDVVIHKYPGINSFSKEVRSYYNYYETRYGKMSDYLVKTDSLEEIASFRVKPLYSKDSSVAFIPMPASLSEGQYVVTVSRPREGEEPERLQTILQLSNVSLYTQSSNGDSVFWLNDPVTGEAMAGARLTLENKSDGKKQEAETQQDGAARVMTGKEEAAYLTVTQDGSSVWFNRVPLSEQREPTLNQNYYSVLYTDREVYQPDDVIRFWGVVRPRRVTASMPSEVVAALRSNDGWGDGVTADAIRVKAAVSADGSFSGELTLSGVRGSYYQFAVTAGEEDAYYSKTLPVMEYTKPAYVITASTDKEVYYYNENPVFTISAKYFDGTPVSGGKLSLSGSRMQFGNARELQLTLDENGSATATASFRRETSDVLRWTPISANYWISSSDEQDVQVNASGSFTVLPSKFAAEIESESPDKLTVRTAALDPSRISENGATPYPAARIAVGELPTDFARYKGAAADIPFTVLVHKEEFITTQTGSYYDPVNKKNVPTYRTTNRSTLMPTLRGTTKNGEAVFEDLPYENSEDLYYWFELRFDGGAAGEVADRGSRLLRYQDPDALPYYQFMGPDAPGAVPLNGEFTVGLYNHGVAVKNEGRVLCSLLQKQVSNLGVFATDTQKLTFEEEDLPGVWLAGAYFDGRHVYSIERGYLAFDYGEKTLQLSLSADKEAYRPGETATVTLNVADAEGKPAAASACIGVVDESVFAVEEQELDLAGELYQQIYWPELAVTTSYDPVNSIAPQTESAEDIAAGEAGAYRSSGKLALNTGGGGDMGQLRQNFSDTALFLPVPVDASGKATVTLTLPDNVTGWRFTAAAVTDTLSAGDATSSAVTTLPFYLLPLMSGQYLEGDDLVASAAAGGSVKGEDPVSYTVTINDASGKKVDEITASGTAGARTAFNLGKYDAGAYTMTISGQSGENKDAVKRPFNVVKSGLIVPVTRTMPLDEVSGVRSARYPVQVSVFDERLTDYMKALSWLSNQDGERTEIIAAAYRARVKFNALLPREEQQVIGRDARLDSAQTQEGGARILPQAQADPASTAKLLLASQGILSNGPAKVYLQEVLADPAASLDSRVMAYAGLAALKEPVLLDLKRILSQNSAELTAVEKLYLGAGLAALGDFSSADEIYQTLSEKQTREGNQLYMEGDGTLEGRMEATAAALTLCSLSGNEDANAYAAFLLAQEENTRGQLAANPYHLALLTWCEKYKVPSGADKGKFRYVDANGAEQEVSIDPTGCVSLRFTAEQLAAANFKVTAGKLSAAVSYMDYPTGPADNGHKLTVTKTYTPVGGGEQIKTGGRVLVEIKLTFDPSAPEGCYNVTDYLPSGLRYLSEAPIWRFNPNSSYDYYMHNDGQTMTGYVYRVKPEEAEPGAVMEAAAEEKAVPVIDGDLAESIPASEGSKTASPNEYTLAYYASAVLPGDFVSESTYVTPHADGISARSERGKLTVEK